jgi:hypothetical protein
VTKNSLVEAYVMKLVLACIDMPNWSRTIMRWCMKSASGIAKPLREEIKSFGSIMLESGLHLVQRLGRR